MTTSFVHAAGTQFLLDGQPFLVNGANNYYLSYGPDFMVKAVFDLAVQMGLNSLRTWGFQDCGTPVPGQPHFQYLNAATGKPDYNDGPDGLQLLDRTIFLAEQKDIRLILPLVNYWDDFGGVNQYLKWLGLTGKDQFYTYPEAQSAYRNYVEHVLLRVNTRTGRQYRDEPAILAWELANEPRCPGDAGTLIRWADQMSSFVRSLDSNHLIGVGDEGYFRQLFAFGNNLHNGSFGVDCDRLLELPGLDFGTCHLYPDFAPNESPVTFGVRWVGEHIEAGQRAGKPMIIEEYGVKSDAGQEMRVAAFAAWRAEVEAQHGAGAMLWMIAAAQTPDGTLYPDYDHYTVYAA